MKRFGSPDIVSQGVGVCQHKKYAEGSFSTSWATNFWTPAFAGMTNKVLRGASSYFYGHRRELTTAFIINRMYMLDITHQPI